jgi:hypothetical protein
MDLYSGGILRLKKYIEGSEFEGFRRGQRKAADSAKSAKRLWWRKLGEDAEKRLVPRIII